MIRRLLKWMLRGSVALVALVILLFATLAFILNTESGTRWVLDRANAAVPGELIYGPFEGALWGGLQFESLGYADADREIEVTRLELRVNWSALWAGRVTLKRLGAESVRVTSLSEAPAEPMPLEVSFAPLPVDISLTTVAVRELILVSPSGTTKLADIGLDRARLDGRSLRLRSAEVALDAGRLSVSALGMTLANDIPLTSDIAWELAEGGWSGRGSIRGSLANLTVDQSIEGPYPAGVTGAVRLLHRVDPEVDLLVNWELWTLGDYKLVDGEVQLAGVLADYASDYDVTIRAPDLREYQLTGNLTGSALERWSVAATLTGEAGQLETSAEVAREGEATLISGLQVSGELLGAPLTAAGDIRIAADMMQCKQCELMVGGNRLQADGGTQNEVLTLALSLDAPTLGTLWPEFSGVVKADAKLSGNLRQPSFTASANGRQLFIGDAELGSGVITAQGGLEAATVDLRWQLHELQLTANAGIQQADGAVIWVVNSASVLEPQTGKWSLTAPAQFTVAGADVTVGTNVWAGDSGTLTVSRFGLVNDDLELNATINEIPLQLIQPFLPQNYRLLGSADAELQLARVAGEWSGAMEWRQSDTILRVTDTLEQVTDVRIPRVAAAAELRAATLLGNLAVSIEPGVEATLNAELTGLSRDGLIDAELHVKGDDWGWLSAVVPQIDQFEGPVTADMVASGPLTAPEFTGNVTWKDGKVLVPAMNVVLADINLVVSGASAGTATVTGSALAGGGAINITGQFENVMRATRSVGVRITGENAELLNWPEYHIWASPALQINGNADGWTVNGSVMVPRADISLREIPEEAVTVSEDVVVLGEEDEEDTLATRVSGEAELTLGKAVRFNALGLDTRLSGSLLLRLARNRPISGQGRVSLVEGKFTAYGQKLTIQEGTLTFTGPLDDPIVNVKAVRIIETLEGTVTAGIHLRGRASDLTSTVFAQPAMADADALSYIVIGRPLSQATASEGGELSGAAVALGLRQATRLTEQIGQALGLDQLSLAGDGGDTTALVAGKQINPRLYARYAYGVFSRLGTLLVRYRLSRRLTLEAGAGENQSIDIMYSVEK